MSETILTSDLLPRLQTALMTHLGQVTGFWCGQTSLQGKGTCCSHFLGKETDELTFLNNLLEARSPQYLRCTVASKLASHGLDAKVRVSGFRFFHCLFAAERRRRTFIDPHDPGGGARLSQK